MNGLTMNELCCLFCCPPCPSKIVAKLAFLPPPPTYKLVINEDQTAPTIPNPNGLNGSTNSSQSNEATALQTGKQEQESKKQENTQETGNIRNNRKFFYGY